jgi:uncharacterized membrane protein
LKFRFNFRFAFFVFAACYLSFLIAFMIPNLPNMPIQWDEAAHLDNGMFLKLGMFDKFTGNLFYPPLYDFLTFASFSIFGVSVVSARAVDALFSVLLLWVVFEFTNKAYDGKTALLASVFLSIMPGYFAASHFAMLDVTMAFFFTLSMFFFFLWLQNSSSKWLVFAGITLFVGFFVKYQIIVAVLVMFIAVLILAESRLKGRFSKKNGLILILILTAVALLIFSTHSYIAVWLKVIGMNTTGSQTMEPAFYLTQTQSIYPTIHPISLLMYSLGFAGLGIFILRRQKIDKLLLIWFLTILIFYTLLPNKNWRYVIPLYPVLAISASVFVGLAYRKLRNSRKIIAKIGALILIAFVCLSLFQSISDNIAWINFEKTPFSLEPAVDYSIKHNNSNQSLIVLCPNNLFSYGIIEFYLLKNGGTQMQLYSYPASTTINPEFNVSSLISLCKQNDIKFVFITEYLGEKISYLNLTLMDVFAQIYDSGNFTHIGPEQTFGQFPRRIYILNFTG